MKKIIITEAQYKLYKEYKLFENDMNEVSDEVYSKIASEYSKSRITMDPRTNEQGKLLYKPTKQKGYHFKPKGLWYSIGTEWIDWVRSEMPEWEKDDAYLLEVDESRLLKLETVNDTLYFTKQYGDERGDTINWEEVGEDYGGIEIPEYLYDLRFKLNWYYPWDVASGCIWGEGILKNAKKLN